VGWGGGRASPPPPPWSLAQKAIPALVIIALINARIYDIMYLLLQIMIVCSDEFDVGIVLCA
jgi:hypothetical protein